MKTRESKSKGRKLKAAAIITLRDADKMSNEGRKEVAAWMRETAKSLVKDGNVYSGEIRFRYLY
jgi:acetylglutamate kinase